ncbi:ANM_HP_G0083640.mRNA.1.CDS.1 [Saccharomyces cerevisiae]|nr:ANM_HP_G0203660.mRNA.1.CDS.1 [Saccharomyces cerevisiae]CAI5160817.1 ANM_HP_G0235310.mRNA.1.CDS.1 [Saccharomyces cerevisiae]CAI5226510.1 ANM_HP_G0083640.mRNA.1.CDS.1 [Saccharomyces cerevisiae]CAI6660259.1 ANM_collapsed_G0018720.mRNA.1.CDS.1 [Saccharomyces cerevisiae]CAI6963471.1 ANM_HP_G0203660.mRNA.1.CDS.1 [Saccharomyces cerevisiae]
MPIKRLDTVVVNTGSQNDQHSASVPPVYLSTTFKVDLNNEDAQNYDYSRSGNPTRSVLQHQIGKLYRVPQENVLAVSSGMTALDVILRGLVLLNGTDNHTPTIIAGDDLYGGTQRLLNFFKQQSHAVSVHVDTSDFEKFKTVFQSLDKVDCVLLESPTNPLCKVVDIPRILRFVKRISPDTTIVVDNTMMSGLNCNPLQLNPGCDVVYESATKYLNGHHDLMGGVIISKTPEIASKLYFVINSTGAGLSPMDSWLLVRGLKTLGVRLYQQQRNAMILAHWLENSCGFKPTRTNKATKTRFVGLRSNPDFKLHKSFNNGPGAVLSFETGSFEHSKRLVSSKKLSIWAVTVSFGCVNSLLSMPCKMSHASIDPELRKERDFPEDLVRLCCGIENIVDLKKDLLAAMVDADIIEVRENGKYLFNKLNKNLAVNTTIDDLHKPLSIYEEFYNQDLIRKDSELNIKSSKL